MAMSDGVGSPLPGRTTNGGAVGSHSRFAPASPLISSFKKSCSPPISATHLVHKPAELINNKCVLWNLCNFNFRRSCYRTELASDVGDDVLSDFSCLSAVAPRLR